MEGFDLNFRQLPDLVECDRGRLAHQSADTQRPCAHVDARNADIREHEEIALCG